MRRLFFILLMALAGSAPASAFDTQTQDVLDRMKPGKLVPIADVGTLMMQSERWCYRQAEGNCAWSDIYLEVTEAGASYEIGNTWSDAYDIVFIDRGVFSEGRYICEIEHEWLDSVRMLRRSDGSPVGGRDLAALKAEILTYRGTPSLDCFDYILEGSDAEAETITLRQRQFTDGVTDPAQDAVVTLHFKAETAAALGWYL